MSSQSVIAMDPASSPRVGTKISAGDTTVELYSTAKLPTRYGDFSVYVFRNNIDDLEHVALVRGENLSGAENVPVRVHSECLTGDVLGSLRCDCRDQLEVALDLLGSEDKGILVYMRQEGRGIGLGNKIKAYALQQQQGLDTVDANKHLGLDDDLRDYTISGLILNAFELKSIILATNNPLKVKGLENVGVQVAKRLPVITQLNPHNVDYLRTKARKSGHLLPLS